MKTLFYITLTLSLLATGFSLKTVAKTNEVGGSNFLRAGSRRTEETCDSVKKIICSMQNTVTFCDMVEELEATNAEFSEKLSGGTAFTVFAPTNEAFGNVTEQLAQLSDKEKEEIILFHFNEGSVLTYEDLECTMTLMSLNGDTSRTKCRRKSVGVYAKHQRGSGNEKLEQFPRIDSKSKEACDGIIHRLDQVMLPSLYKPFKEFLPEKEPDNVIIIDDPEEESESSPDETDNSVSTPVDTPQVSENGDMTTTGDQSIEKEDKVDQGDQGGAKKDPPIGALGINLIIFSTLLLCFVFVCMRR
eukprot:CAMPEP_0116133966 /NCGR_PEP_ID=MMETSP0329-20121206/10395_1 /TAXON_ID=697910 /ORGANISM="Pseudo-nitzschia arenysensis, Strain B593" /LENGTH=301 /DNA_ID=CAMNT_0003628647 /DNA_START=265 /DNA_END=1170 /DNA_ORIENTATION=-